MRHILSFLFKPTSWLFSLLIITSALHAGAQDLQELDGPFDYKLTDDEKGYIIHPLHGVTYEGDLFVPSVRESDGLPVVGVDGFQYQKSLLFIAFPEDSQVKYIGSFEGCTGIEFVDNIPKTVETIGDYAFYGCTRLWDVTLNEGLQYIGISCFEGCTSLTSIKLPSTLKVLRERAFRVCTALETVEFDDRIDFYDGNLSYGFYNNVFDGCENLHTVKLPYNPDTIFNIPMSTFSWCGNLKSIEFPANTQRIDQMAFYRTGIENLDFTKITSDVFVEGYYTFSACNNLQSVKANGNFKFGVTSLYTFQDCKALKTVTINGSGDDYIKFTPDAFRFCDNLESVEVYRLKGSGEPNEMDSVFVGCKKLQRVISTCPPELNKFGYCCFDGCESLKEVPIPTQAFLINDQAFRGCAALESIDLANVTSIGDEAFTGCSALASINLNPSSDNLPTVENENAFDAWHFANTLITVPDDKYSVFTADAFWSKFQIKHPSLFAFTEVPGGYSVSKSPYALISDFPEMLEIPEQYESGNVVAIAEGAFQGLTMLTGVTLPEGLTSIGSLAFNGCTNLRTVINKAIRPIYNENVFEDAFDDATYQGSLYVPFGSLDAYSKFSPWANFASRIYQGFGERSLQCPMASHESGDFNYSFDLTLTPTYDYDSANIYYYIVTEDDDPYEVHTVYTYSAPIKIKKSCKVVAYLSDGTQCSDPISLEYTYKYLPSVIFDCTSIPQGTQENAFTTDNPGPVFNQVIDNVYYSITDNNSGCDPTAGLVLNATSSIDDVYEFNSAVESAVGPTYDFNGIAIKVQGVGSITFNGVTNQGNARLTLVLGNGPAVYVDELVEGKYEFSVPVEKYLYIFASQTSNTAAPQLKSLASGENGVTLRSVTFDITDLYINTETGLDKVLTANGNDNYRINTPLYGHYHDGAYLYASTMDNSGSSKNTFNEDKKAAELSDKESDFNQEDWVAISDLTSDFVGKKIGSGKVASVIGNSNYPVIKFNEEISTEDSSMDINEFRVENFNIHADNVAVNNIWLVAPQPAEYCSVTGYIDADSTHPEEGYLTLKSAESETISENETIIQPLSLKVYYDPATIILDDNGEYTFAGIVKREGDGLAFTVVKILNSPYMANIEDVDADEPHIFAANGKINVAANAITSITVFSTTGQVVTSLKASSATIAVAPGLYLVRVGNKTAKIAVK